MMRTCFVVLIIILLSGCVAKAQLLPYNRQTYDLTEGRLQQEMEPFFTSVKPFLTEQLSQRIPLDSLLYPQRSGRFYGTLAGRKIFNENLFCIDTGGFFLALDPVFEFSLGQDREKTWMNSRGFIASGKIGHDLSFGTEFYENQAVFPDYLDSWVRENGVVPGQGSVKDFNGKGFDYSSASGYLSYTPSRYFNIQFGHGKHFIGDGYRSLLLSDNAFSYPYLKITTTVWKLQYTNLFAQFMDRKSPWSGSLGYTRKYGTFHFLSAGNGKRFTIGLFEAILWEAADSTGTRGFDINYLNPVIFYRPVEFSLGSPDNALIGVNLKYRISNTFSAYGQVILDEFKLEHVRKQDGWWANKQGFQAGLAGWNLFRINTLNFRAEYNYVRPYTYSHWTTLESYGHYNQPLAHPFGANFSEIFSSLHYSIANWYFSCQLIYATYGLDTAGMNYGKNIFLSYNTHPLEYHNKVGQGLKTTLVRNDLLLAYRINPRTNMRLEAGVSFRKEENSQGSAASAFYWIGLKTNLRNVYQDF